MQFWTIEENGKRLPMLWKTPGEAYVVRDDMRAQGKDAVLVSVEVIEDKETNDK